MRDPPRQWRFIWFPGDFEIIGNSLEETVGFEQAALLRALRALDRAESLPRARHALEQFIRDHPGDPTAISAGLLYVLAEQALLC